MQSQTKKKITTQQLLHQYRNEDRRDFSNIILKGKNIKDVKLAGANFGGANLNSTNFERAKLQNTNFSNAKLKGVNFSNADLTGANFSQVKASFLINWFKIFILILPFIFRFEIFIVFLILLLVLGLPLSFLLRPYLSILTWFTIKTKFHQSNLNGAIFRSAKLQEIDFSKSLNLEKVNFHNASLQGANFGGLNLEGNDFNLTYAVWNGTRQLQYAKFGRNNYLRYPQIRQLFTNNFLPQPRRINKLIWISRYCPNGLKKPIRWLLKEKTFQLTKDFNNCDLRGIQLTCIIHELPKP